MITFEEKLKRITDDEGATEFLITYVHFYKIAPRNAFKNHNWFISVTAHNASLCPL